MLVTSAPAEDVTACAAGSSRSGSIEVVANGFCWVIPPPPPAPRLPLSSAQLGRSGLPPAVAVLPFATTGSSRSWPGDARYAALARQVQLGSAAEGGGAGGRGRAPGGGGGGPGGAPHGGCAQGG